MAQGFTKTTGTITGITSPFTLSGTSVTSTGTQLNYINTLTVVPLNKVVIQTFTGSGTYTPTTGMKYCIIEAWGAGGGGGGAADSSGDGRGGGGGAGAYSLTLASASDIGASKAVTIGSGGSGGASGNNAGTAGGATSVGTLCVSGGGGGGGGAAANSRGAAGSSGVSSAGTVKGTGMTGMAGSGGTIITYRARPLSGSTLIGSGQPAQITPALDGLGYGAGGGPGLSRNSGGASVGGAGAPGFISVTEYLSV